MTFASTDASGLLGIAVALLVVGWFFKQLYFDVDDDD